MNFIECRKKSLQYPVPPKEEASQGNYGKFAVFSI